MTLFYQLIFCRQLTKLKLIILKLYFLLPKKSVHKKTCNIHGETPVLESLFNKENIAPENISKCFRTPILANICKRLLLFFL